MENRIEENLLEEIMPPSIKENIKECAFWKSGYKEDAPGGVNVYYMNVCSACGEPSIHRYKYCPNCGIKTDGSYKGV